MKQEGIARIQSRSRAMKSWRDATAGLAIAAMSIFVVSPRLFGATALLSPLPSSYFTVDGENADARVSTDGRYVVFTSEAGDLVAGDTNQKRDVFMRDRQTGTTELISKAWGQSVPADGASECGTVTPDGRYVVFESEADNLVSPGLFPTAAGPGRSLIYRYDRQTDQMILINVNRPIINGDPFISQALTNLNWSLVEPSITPDGHHVLFELGRLQAWGLQQTGFVEPDLGAIFVWNETNGVTDLMTDRFQTNPPESTAAYSPKAIATTAIMSDNERYVAIARGSTNVLSGGTTNLGGLGSMNVVVHDLVSRTNALPNLKFDSQGVATVRSQRSEPAGFSASGETLLFEARGRDIGYLGEAAGGNQAQLWIYDLLTGLTTMVSSNSVTGTPGNDSSFSGALSGDGNWVAYFSMATNLVNGDADSVIDIYLYSRQSGTNIRISSDPSWHGLATPYPEQPPQLTSDGHFVVYQAIGSGLYRYDRVAGTNALITTDVGPDSPALSDDGRFVVFTALPASINPSDSNPYRQVYCHDFEAGVTELISTRNASLPAATPQGATSLELAAISSTGRYIAFTSFAPDIGAGGSRQGRLWVRDTQLGTNILVSVDQNGQPLTDGDVFRNVQMSADGRWISFVSRSTNLVDNDSNRYDDVFLRDLQTGVTRLVSQSSQTGTSASGPSFNPVMARNGSKIVFNSHATDLLPKGGYNDLYAYDVASASNTLITVNYTYNQTASQPCDQQVLSPDGQWMFFRCRDAYLTAENCFSAFSILAYRDLTGYGPNHCVTNAVNSPPLLTGSVGKWSISENGQWFVGNIYFNTQSEIYLGHAGTNAVWLVSTNGYAPLVSNDGLSIAWQSPTPALGYPDTNGTWDVFHYRADLGVLRVISLDDTGTQTGNGPSRLIALSPDGRYVLFRSLASNLVVGDNNQSMDLFLRDTATDLTILISRSFAGTGTGDNFTGKALFTDDGTKIIFESYASDLVANDNNLDRDVFVAQLQSTDSDGDGLPDDWELTYFGNLSHDGTADTDGDGVSDDDEFLAGTSPINSASVLRAITVTGVGSGTTMVIWSAVPGKSYQIQYRESVEGPGWSNLGGTVTANGGTGGVVDPQPATSQRFYRVLLVQ